MKKSKKKLTGLVALILVVVCAVGATVAYITTKTDTVTNKFTVGNIDIDLDETTDPGDYVIVPGNDISKDPKVTVAANSEDAYIFVKVEKTNDFDTYMEYEMADGWIALAGVDGVYYREYSQTATDTMFDVLKDNKVTVRSNLTKAQLDAIGEKYPTLSFTAYAVQKDNITDAATAWVEANS